MSVPSFVLITTECLQVACVLFDKGTAEDRLYGMLMIGTPAPCKKQLKEAKRFAMRYRSSGDGERFHLMQTAIDRHIKVI